MRENRKERQFHRRQLHEHTLPEGSPSEIASSEADTRKLAAPTVSQLTAETSGAECTRSIAQPGNSRRGSPATGGGTGRPFGSPYRSFEQGGASTIEVSVLQNLSQEQLQLVRERAVLKSIRTGVTLLSMGHTGTGVFLLLEGTVKIFVTSDDGDEIIIALTGPGDLLGEIDAVDHCGHSAYAATLEPCQALWWSVEEFEYFQEEIPQLSRNLLSMLVRRERRNTGRSSALAKLNLTGRVARQLLIFAQAYGVRKENGMVLPLRLTQTEIAALVGSSRTCVNRVLAGFKAKKYITMDRSGRITLCNIPALVALCQGLCS